MIDLDKSTSTNRFNISLDAEEMLAISRALHWYGDKLTNMERQRGRDNGEWDVVMYLHQQLADLIKRDAYL